MTTKIIWLTVAVAVIFVLRKAAIEIARSAPTGKSIGSELALFKNLISKRVARSIDDLCDGTINRNW